VLAAAKEAFFILKASSETMLPAPPPIPTTLILVFLIFSFSGSGAGFGACLIFLTISQYKPFEK
jgi:hypothetical protein